MQSGGTSSSGTSTAAAGLSLTSAIISSVAPGSVVTKFGIDIYNWLQRERISEDAFNRCMTLAKCLAYPNANGKILHEQLEASATNLRAIVAKAPIGVILAGSLGRTLINESETCYLVSTVAALAQHHDLEAITQCLTEFLVRDENTPFLVQVIQRDPIRAVVKKIVDSIYLNVVNAGHHGKELPDQLADLCPHFLSAVTMASLMRRLSTNVEQDITIRSSRFLADLTLWCITHFHGRLIVSLGGVILLDHVLGEAKTTLRMLIDKDCDRRLNEGHACAGDVKVEASIATSSSSKIDDIDMRSSHMAYRGIVRKSLYQRYKPSHSRMLQPSHDSFIDVIHTAKAIMG